MHKCLYLRFIIDHNFYFAVISSIRLASGTVNMGRVEVFHSGSWGTVCDDLWTQQNSVVVCQ